MTPEQQAVALADWLATHPGTEPPAALDADVVEAIVALRPDLAPPPRVSIDDILGGVTSGPLAVPTAVVAPPVAPQPANRPRWRLPATAASLLALAAGALVTVQIATHRGTPEATFTLADHTTMPSADAPPMAQTAASDADNTRPGAHNELKVVGGLVATRDTAPLDAVADADMILNDGFAEDEATDGVADLRRDQAGERAPTPERPLGEATATPIDAATAYDAVADVDDEMDDDLEASGLSSGSGGLGLLGYASNAPAVEESLAESGAMAPREDAETSVSATRRGGPRNRRERQGRGQRAPRASAPTAGATADVPVSPDAALPAPVQATPPPPRLAAAAEPVAPTADFAGVRSTYDQLLQTNPLAAARVVEPYVTDPSDDGTEAAVACAAAYRAAGRWGDVARISDARIALGVSPRQGGLLAQLHQLADEAAAHLSAPPAATTSETVPP